MVRTTASTFIAAGMLAAGAFIVPATAATFKWASASDIPTWDIHSQNNALANGVHAAVYESLFYYNRKFELEPMLATGFKQLSPTQVRITLRKGVKFHDGAAFDAAWAQGQRWGMQEAIRRALSAPIERARPGSGS